MSSTPAPRSLRPYQVEATRAVEDAWKNGNNRPSVVLPTGTGKPLADSTLVITPSGVKTHGDLIVGDFVFHPSGRTVRITHVHPQGDIDVWRVGFSDGTSIVAGGGHLWSVFRDGVSDILTTSSIHQSITNGERPWSIPLTSPIIFSADESLQDFRTEALRLVHETEHISDDLLFTSVIQRVRLLSAVVDALRGDQAEVSVLTSPSDDVTRRIQMLTWSLGGTMSVTDNVYVRVSLPVGVTVPGLLSESDPHRHIVSVTYAGVESCQCITVDESDGLYLAGKEFIVTHNSTVIANVATRARRNGKKTLLLAHRTELLDQMAGAVQAVDPGGQEVGIVAADRNDFHTDIVAASFQTLSRSPNRLAALGTRDVILADEAHHISAATYTGVLENMGALDPASGVNSCGFTATMYRDDGKQLGDVWREVVFEKDLMWAIREGYLIAPRGKTIAIKGLNQLASIRTVRGDYNQTELAEVMNASVDSTVDAILRHCPDRAMIVFAAGVEHARTLAEKLTVAGIPSKDVTGSHKRDYRESAYSEFREGKLNCLVTVQVLTEGADFPRCDAVVLARPTRSKVLLTQIIGRAVRTYTDPDTGLDKDDALVVDLTGVVRDAKLTSLTDLYPEAKREVYTEDGDEVTGTDKDPTMAPPEKERKGRLELEDIDLVEGGTPYRSKVLWLKSDPLNTDGDEIAFMPLRHPRQYVFLYPPLNRVTDKGVMLGRLEANRSITFVTDPSGNIVRGNIAEAMAAAEQIVGSTGYIRKDAQWRKPGVKPSDSQKSLAKNLNINVDVDMLNKAELSDIITLRLARPLLTDIVRRTGYPPD